MGDLILKGQPTLNLAGTLKLVARAGGKVMVSGSKALVETDKASAPSSGQGTAVAPVIIPPPPGTPLDMQLNVWITKSFNATVTANGKNIVALGLCVQGQAALSAIWPGMVLPSTSNMGVTINHVSINVEGDMAIILPSGGSVTFTTSGQ